MSVTILAIEDAILAALAADETIAAWKGDIISGDEAALRIGKRVLRYPALVVAYGGAPEGGMLAGGTGAGATFKRQGEFQVFCLAKNYRGVDEGRRGDPVSARFPGAYAMIERVLTVLGYKRLSLDIRRLEYVGDEHYECAWDEQAVGYLVRVATQWETTCAAD